MNDPLLNQAMNFIYISDKNQVEMHSFYLPWKCFTVQLQIISNHRYSYSGFNFLNNWLVLSELTLKMYGYKFEIWQLLARVDEKEIKLMFIEQVKMKSR